METQLETSETAFRDALAKRNKQLETTKEEILKLAQETAQCGVFAREMQLLVVEKRFDLWFTERKFGCSIAAVKSFIKFSERRQEVTDGFEKTLLALPGLVEQSTREDGSQHKLPQASCRWISALMKAQEAINLAQEQAPIEDWPDAHRITLMDSLRPLSELYEKLCREQ